MKVHLIKRQTIEQFAARHARGRTSFEDWLEKIRLADWNETNDIKKTFNAADLLGKGSSRVIFDIAGNLYRIICKYAFGDTEVHLFVCWIGTHAEYDRLCSEEKQYSVSIY